MIRILVPTDFSPTAERAFRFAAELASKSKGTIILFHVNEKEEIPYFDSTEKKDEYQKQLETKQLKRLQRLKKKVVSHEMNVMVSTVVSQKPVVKNMLSFAKQTQVELIVMGTQGASGLKKTIVGSNASRIIERSKIPVLVVPEKYDWKDPKEIVFATNYHCEDRPALSFTLSVAKVFNANVTVVHVNQDEIDKDTAQCFSNYAYFLQRTFNDSQIKFKELKSTHIKNSLEHLQDTIPFDILVMVRRNKKFLDKIFLKSFTKNMACTTKLPLLVVPEEE
ncbi:MAG: universal stress protein [Bacteroidota bacterium]|nr:universal stress protein [Bacteroidota bacterium]